MTATQTKIRGGTAAQCDAMTPAERELLFDTTNKRIRGGDGLEQGGWHIPNSTDVQTNAFTFATVGGTADDLELTLDEPLQAYGGGVGVIFVATDTNTGPMTADVDELGPQDIMKMSNGALSAMEEGDVVDGGIYSLLHDGTRFQLKGLNEATPAAGWELISIATGGGTTYNFSGITNDYAGYAFLLDKVRPATDAVALIMRIRRSGQGSVDSGATDYEWQQIVAFSTTVSSSAQANNTSIQLTSPQNNSGNDGFGFSGMLHAPGLGSTGRVAFSMTGVGRTGSTLRSAFAVGERKTTTAIDLVQFRFASGDISAGTIYMFGIKGDV
jgi:hypothetical protein